MKPAESKHGLTINRILLCCCFQFKLGSPQMHTCNQCWFHPIHPDMHTPPMSKSPTFCFVATPTGLSIMQPFGANREPHRAPGGSQTNFSEHLNFKFLLKFHPWSPVLIILDLKIGFSIAKSSLGTPPEVWKPGTIRSQVILLQNIV